MWEVSRVVGVKVGGRRPSGLAVLSSLPQNKSAWCFIMLLCKTLHYKHLSFIACCLARLGAKCFSASFVSSQKSPEAACFLLSFIQMETQHRDHGGGCSGLLNPASLFPYPLFLAYKADGRPCFTHCALSCFNYS